MAERYTMVEALNRALDEEMERDDSMVLLGEDVGEDGGVFRVTDGLHQKYNEADAFERVIDTPLDELGILGASLGLSVQGKNPVPEMQFSGFIYPGFNQIIGHISRYRTRTRGEKDAQMVIRAPYGGGIEAPELHSDSMEALYTHTPGLKVAMPSGPREAYGLLKGAIRDPDPVIFMEPKRIYRSVREELPDGDYTIPLGEADVKREGDDVTVVSWGVMTPEALDAAEALEEQGISTEVVDMRTVSPLDMETVEESYRKTGKLVLAQEGPRTAGVGAEISARITEDDHDLLYLEAPIKRVAGYDTIVPLPAHEERYLPGTDDIVDAVQDVHTYEF